MGRTMQSALALVAKRLLADLRLSPHGVSAATSPQDVLAARRALKAPAVLSAWPASASRTPEEKLIWPPSARSFWCSSGNKSASMAAAIHILHTSQPSQDTGRALKQHPDVCCLLTLHGQPAPEGGSNISRLALALQQQWDHAANAHLGLIDITPMSGRKVWWICRQCPDGHLHRWEATVFNRSRGNGCPQCAGRKVCMHNSLASKAPKVAAQWDYVANDSTPDDVVAQSSHPVGWLCEVCGEQWSQSPNQRVSKQKAGCPQCARKANRKRKIKHPTFAECQDPQGKAVLEGWDHERNPLQGNFPHNITLRSTKRIFWLCNKCPAGQQHSWFAKPLHRTLLKTGCPFCAGRRACRCNSLQELYPAIAAEWRYAKNEGRPEDHTAGSHFMAWWSTPQRGSWQQSIHARTNYAHNSARSKHIQQRLPFANPS